jgi:DNA-binding response OmpR family regulator/HPt (histidine-containing phosphotransfer) domain-containing protein
LALQGLWGKYIPKNREHVRVLADSIAVIQTWAAVEQAADQTMPPEMTTEQWQQAQVAAHKLVGTLGLFGRPQGSQLALSLENFFRAQQLPSPTELLALVQQVQELDAIVQPNPPNNLQHYPALPSSIPSTSSTPSPTVTTTASTGLPLCQDFVLIGLDHDPAWAEQMGKLAKNCFTQFSSIEQFAAYVASYKQRHESSNPTQFQLLLLNLSLADFSSQQTAMLKTLTEQIPPALILVCTDQASLDLRIQLAQAGVYAVLPKLSPQQVWSLVKHLRLVDATLPKRILTVDDDPQVLDMLQSSLEAWGLQVSCLEHSSQFWETLHSCAPDLLILDVEMPHYSGIDLCRTVRNTLDWQNLPILFLTAHTDIATLQDAVNAGANALIYKSAPQIDIVHHVLVKLQHANRNFF